MKREKNLRFVVILGLLQFFLIPVLSEGFDDRAHIRLSTRATELSTLNSFLTTNLGFEFPNGRNETIVNGKSVTNLVEDGAFDEDRPILWRPRHHFHNPRLAWDQAGWRPPPFSIQLGESSVIWSQDSNQSVGGKHSWKDARDSYFQALTATSDSERKRLYGETFKSLGHLIHLVQDAAVPSHARNDTHINYSGIGDPDAFHGWAESVQARDMIAGTTPPPFNSSLLNQSSPNAFVPVPIARIIDSTDEDIGSLALSPGLNIGIAEYSSANFFSDDTVNSPNFLSPVSSQVEVRPPEPDATGAKLRRYVYFRPGFGEQDYPLALASAMLPYVIDPLATPTENGLDAKVFQGYGTKLFPRAVAYSAGLIDYFFRGTIEAAPSTPGIGYPPSSPPSTLMLRFVYNFTPGEQTGAGNLRLVLRFNNSASTGDTFPAVLVSNSLSATVPNQWEDNLFTFQFPGPLPFPSNVGGVAYYDALLVYTGPLGLENDAVVVLNICAGYQFYRYRDLPPPYGTGEELVSLYGGCPA